MNHLCLKLILIASLAIALAGLFPTEPVSALTQETTFSTQEKPIVDQLKHLRALPDDVRARTTKQLAVDIRRLPLTKNKLNLAEALANLSTEGDFGHDALQ